MLAPQYDPDRGNAAIETPSTPLHVELGIRCSPWRQHPNIGVVGDLQGALARSLRQATFGFGLQAPGDTPEQKLAVRGPRFLSKRLPDPQSGSLHFAKLRDCANAQPKPYSTLRGDAVASIQTSYFFLGSISSRR